FPAVPRQDRQTDALLRSQPEFLKSGEGAISWPLPPSLGLDLFEHASDADEVIVEDISCHIEELENRRIAHRVIHIRSGLSRHDDVLVTQHRKLLRRIGLLDSEFRADFGNGPLTTPQAVQNGNAQRMRQSFEEFGFKISQLRHL